jgi:NAD(P)-dependent dehydrogenase (short-subunit alcohol dehydrogenase family)
MNQRATASRTATSAPMTEPTPPFPPQKQEPPGLERDILPAPRWRAERYRAADKLAGQVAIVTGGDSGIGRAVAYLFAREGADVTIVCLPEEETDACETKAAVEQVGRHCLMLVGDLRQAGFCDQVVRDTLNKFGRLDVLVHNAAWQNRKSITEISEDELDRTLKTNVYSYIRLCRAAVPHMQPGACIIATGSVVGEQGSERLSDYAASKGAIHAITKSLALELVEQGIRVNCVAPGPVWTPLNIADTGMTPEGVSSFGEDPSSSPMRRPAQPEEVSPAFVFLASAADSSFITGEVLLISGGRQ